MAYSKAASDRGIFDPNLPVQGIFDPNIFDTELAAAIETQVLPILIHDISQITVSVHDNSEMSIFVNIPYMTNK